ncbi:MAG: glycosyltransferase [Ignavibacteria bacterium]|nr:glycosyltransferase [Ignavibacteria bacterium]
MPNKKIKILHIAPDGKLYGTERHILALVRHSDTDKFDHYVATPEKGNFNTELEKIGVKYFIAGRKHGYKNKFEGVTEDGSLELFKILRKEKFDIVHSHLNSFGGIVGKLAGAPAVVHTRHGVFWSEEELENISVKDKYFQKLKSGIFDASVAIGEYEKNTMVSKLNYNPEKITVTVNGVDIDKLHAKLNKNLTKKDLFGTDDFIIGSAGRLERQKGFSYFIEAASMLNDLPEKIKFVIIGEGTCKDELMKMREEYGLSDRLIFMDYKENIQDYINNFDIYISTSLWEGMSYSVQEAMALGKPVIAMTSGNVSGLKELIINGESGILIEENYSASVAENIRSLISDEAYRKKLGVNAMERERNNFQEWRTAEDMDKMYLKLYESKNRMN